MTAECIYILDVKFSDHNSYKDLLYTTTPNSIEETLKLATKTFSPDDKHQMRLIYRSRQVKKDNFEAEPKNVVYYAPNGQKLDYSPLSSANYIKGLVTFTHDNKVYEWDGLRWKEKLS